MRCIPRNTKNRVGGWRKIELSAEVEYTHYWIAGQVQSYNMCRWPWNLADSAGEVEKEAEKVFGNPRYDGRNM